MPRAGVPTPMASLATMIWQTEEAIQVAANPNMRINMYVVRLLFHCYTLIRRLTTLERVIVSASLVFNEMQ
eukprot:1374384-Amphidinium_carterae.1